MRISVSSFYERYEKNEKKEENENAENAEREKTKFPKVTQKPSDFVSDICNAARDGKLSSVQYLVEIEKENVETKNRAGWTPLHWASYYGHLDIVKYLVEECHRNVEAKDISGWTPLYWASYNGHLDIAKYLVEEGHARITDGIISDAKINVKEYLKSKT